MYSCVIETYRDKKSGWGVLLTHVGIQHKWDRRDDLKMTWDRVLTVIFELSGSDLPGAYVRSARRKKIK